jgi:hypothetical protein
VSFTWLTNTLTVYPLPNDEVNPKSFYLPMQINANNIIHPKEELDRLDLTHHLMVSGIGDALYLAPIAAGKMHRILDIGTGTGTWALEMGRLFSGSEVS